MIINWFISRTAREASGMLKHVRKLVNHQRDLLSAQALDALNAAMANMRAVLAQGPPPDKAALKDQMQKLESVANTWLKPYPHAAWRENFEVLLVALAVAMGIRTFFLQPFKIPTGSMQPTLYGVTSVNLLEQPGATIPTGWKRVQEWFEGMSYLHVVAKNDGEVLSVSPPLRFLIFNIKQTLNIGGRNYTLWFPPDYGNQPLESRAGLQYGKQFKTGEDVIKLKVSSGDHLFVDRLTYNFRPPKRGEIIVFETRGIPEENRDRFRISGDQFYIKRLVGLGGERIQIGADRHLIVNGKRLDASMPHFERVYSFDPNKPPKENEYSGHVDGPFLAPYFQLHPEGVDIPKDFYMAMGDNTMNSLDSRAWGPFPAKYVIGKSFFVYWPLTERFGWGYHR